MFKGLNTKPSLIVFDLDGTLWPFDAESYRGDKLHLRDGLVYDESNYKVAPYDSSETILKLIQAEPGIKLAVASSTPTPKVARKLLQLYCWTDLFDYVEIYPGCKIQHFNELKRKSNIPFCEMMLFDDLSFNIRDVGSLGVHTVTVRNGVDEHVLRNALVDFAKHSNAPTQP